LVIASRHDNSITVSLLLMYFILKAKIKLDKIKFPSFTSISKITKIAKLNKLDSKLVGKEV